MKNVLRFLIWLYPAWWRRRYGAELEALLEDSGSRWRDVWDLFRGAMMMQLSKWSFATIVVACGVVGLIVGGVWVYAFPAPYRSETVLRIAAGVQPREAAEAALTRRSLRNIIIDGNLYLRERQTTSLDDVIEQMRRAIRITPVSTGGIAISFADQDPSTAQHVAQTLAERFEGFEVLDPPTRPKRVGQQKRLSLAHLGLPGGMLFGVVLALILRRRTPPATQSHE